MQLSLQRYSQDFLNISCPIQYQHSSHDFFSGRFLIEPTTHPSTRPPKTTIDYDLVANTNPCELPPNPGHGYQRLSRWFFDPEDRYCREFFFSGQGGNANNFENEEQCLFACVLRKFKMVATTEGIRDMGPYGLGSLGVD